MSTVYQYNLDGNFIKKYSSILEAANEVKTRPENISRAMDGRNRTAKRFVWRNFQKKKIKVDLSKKGKRKVYQYDSAGNYLRSFESQAHVCRYYKIPASLISQVLDERKFMTALGFAWRSYKKDKVKIREKETAGYLNLMKAVIIEIEGKEVRCKSIKEAALKSGRNRAHLCDLLHGKYKNTKIKIRYALETKK
jgi:NUMOD1 domain